jgi:ribosomal protein S18 acetylase RimI-like enzyme
MIRKDLSSAARILTEEFYSHRTNFITFQIERLKTVLSLESTFPNQRSSLRNEHTRRTLQRMIVACDARNGQVVGFAEVDARPLVGNRSTVSENESSPNEGTTSDDILRSYMYNLAVDKKWKRKGIASALVHACERFVGDTHDLCVEKRLYLRVRKSNLAAIALYESLGYRAMSPEVIHMSKEDINSGSLEDGELILFAKDLPIAGECLLD